MEIKAILNKPYTEEERLDFIVENNHKKGYEIKETETALEAWGYTQDEIEQQKKLARNQEINNKINELQIMSLSDLMHDNKENIKIYNDVIKGLEDML